VKRRSFNMDGKDDAILPVYEIFGKKRILPLHTLSMGDLSTCSSSRSMGNFWTSKPATNLACHEDISYNDRVASWSANPQSATDDVITAQESVVGRVTHAFESHKRSNSNRNLFVWVSSKTTLLLILFVTAITLSSRFSLQGSFGFVATLQENKLRIATDLNSVEKGIRILQREFHVMETIVNQNHDFSEEDLETSNLNKAMEDLKDLSFRVSERTKQASLMESHVQRLSRREALTKYGPGVHRVEMELVFPHNPEDGPEEGPTKFIIELASIDLMPHSVHFFLEMASNGLLDGCSFILNALHVLKAAPLPYDGSSAASKASAFTQHGLESVAFKEYSDKFPHKQYTIGFAADGSPSFYLNTQDNSEIHIGDPCFGKIIEGYDTVKRLEASPTRNGIWFDKRIGIKRATVLS